MKIIKWAFAICALIVVISIFADRSPDNKPATDTATIPYRIINQSEMANENKSYDLLVDLVDGRLPAKDELADISNTLKSSNHKRTFVLFYLPGMVVGDGAFATAHHNPTIQVQINEWALPAQYKHLVKQ